MRLSSKSPEGGWKVCPNALYLFLISISFYSFVVFWVVLFVLRVFLDFVYVESYSGSADKEIVFQLWLIMLCELPSPFSGLRSAQSRACRAMRKLARRARPKHKPFAGGSDASPASASVGPALAASAERSFHPSRQVLGAPPSRPLPACFHPWCRNHEGRGD